MTRDRQYITAFIVHVGYFCAGSVFGWMPSQLARFLHEKRMTSSESSWCLSVLHIGVLVSAIPSGIISSRVGRKPLLIATAPIFILCWVTLFISLTVPTIIIVRIIQGITLGMFWASAPVLIAEMAEVPIRGVLTVLCAVFWGFGLTFEYAIGLKLSHSIVILASVPLHLIFCVGLAFVPDTPYALLLRGERGKAGKALAWYRHKAGLEEVSEELEIIETSVRQEEAERASFKDVVTTREGRRGVLIMILIVSTIIFGGTTCNLVYGGQVFSSSSSHKSSMAYFGPITVTFVSAIGPLVIGTSVDRIGRRPCLIYSAAVVTVLCLGTGIYYGIEETEDAEKVFWLPYFFLVLEAFIQGVMVGISYPLRAELFQSSTRGVASGIVSSIYNIDSFISVKIFEEIAVQAGVYVNFVIFSMINLIGTVLMFFYVPETKGKHFHEIHNMLK